MEDFTYQPVQNLGSISPVEGEPINGDEMFVARCAHFPELAMAEAAPQKAYDGLMAMIEKIWMAKEVESLGV